MGFFALNLNSSIDSIRHVDLCEVLEYCGDCRSLICLLCRMNNEVNKLQDLRDKLLYCLLLYC
jgi:hypothetical protein